MLRTSAALSSIDAFAQKAKTTGFASGALISSVTKKMSKINFSPKEYCSRDAIIMSPYQLSTDDLPLTTLLINSYIDEGHNYYRLNNFDNPTLMNSVSITLFNQTVRLNSSIRSILITCTLLNIAE